jgi:hypothetical protein
MIADFTADFGPDRRPAILFWLQVERDEKRFHDEYFPEVPSYYFLPASNSLLNTAINRG